MSSTPTSPRPSPEHGKGIERDFDGDFTAHHLEKHLGDIPDARYSLDIGFGFSFDDEPSSPAHGAVELLESSSSSNNNNTSSIIEGGLSSLSLSSSLCGASIGVNLDENDNQPQHPHPHKPQPQHDTQDRTVDDIIKIFCKEAKKGLMTQMEGIIDVEMKKTVANVHSKMAPRFEDLIAENMGLRSQVDSLLKKPSAVAGTAVAGGAAASASPIKEHASSPPAAASPVAPTTTTSAGPSTVESIVDVTDGSIDAEHDKDGDTEPSPSRTPHGTPAMVDLVSPAGTDTSTAGTPVRTPAISPSMVPGVNGSSDTVNKTTTSNNDTA
ncbi:unnamed protein product, partial [Scytosiphon promiscuus]